MIANNVLKILVEAIGPTDASQIASADGVRDYVLTAARAFGPIPEIEGADPQIAGDASIPNEFPVQRCCAECGFEEERLIPHAAVEGAETAYLCRECHVYHAPDNYVSEFVPIWMPRYSKTAVSALAKLITLTSNIDFDDLLHRHTYFAEETQIGQRIKIFASSFEATKDPHATGRKAPKTINQTISKVLSSLRHEFALAIEDGRRLFETDSLGTFMIAFGEMDEHDRAMVSTGLRYLPRTVDKKRLGNAKITRLETTFLTALNNDLSRHPTLLIKKDIGQDEGDEAASGKAWDFADNSFDAPPSSEGTETPMPDEEPTGPEATETAPVHELQEEVPFVTVVADGDAASQPHQRKWSEWLKFWTRKES